MRVSRRLFSPLCAPAVSRPVFSRQLSRLFSRRLCARRDAPLFWSLFSRPLCGRRVFSPPLCARLFWRRLCERFFSRPLFSPPLCARVFLRRGSG